MLLSSSIPLEVEISALREKRERRKKLEWSLVGKFITLRKEEKRIVQY